MHKRLLSVGQGVAPAITTSLLALLLGGVLFAGTRPSGRTMPPRPPRPPSPPLDAITEYAVRLRVGPAKRHDRLLLFPILGPGVRPPRVDLTLDKAMAAGLIEVEELKPSEVNRVRLRNRAKRPVFVMGGEMLRGGKQDRIVGDDLLIPAGAELTIPVFCVEHGRWAGATVEFEAGPSLAAPALRASGRAGQSAVWEKVAEIQTRLGAPSPTGAYRSVHDSEQVRARMKPYTRAFSDLPDDFPEAVGVVAMVGGDILAADLFGSPALFRQLWPQLLDSYVIDALERPAAAGRACSREPEARFVQCWLEGLQRAERNPKDTPGEGQLYELRGAAIIGSALAHERAVVHMQLFPALFAERPVQDYNRLQFRREHLGLPDPRPLR